MCVCSELDSKKTDFNKSYQWRGKWIRKASKRYLGFYTDLAFKHNLYFEIEMNNHYFLVPVGTIKL